VEDAEGKERDKETMEDKPCSGMAHGKLYVNI
jgi:hypothetical protein